MKLKLIRFLLLISGLLAAFSPARAEPGLPTHGIAMHGQPALPPDFKHLPYANPNAPKGGRLSLGFQGTFDSLNPFNLKSGSAAQGLNTNIFQTLMARSLDEPFTLYGLIAEKIETDDARSFVQFRLNPKAAFSDGKKITSADVKFSFDLIKSKGRPQQRYAYGQVKRVDTPDDLTIRYDLTGVDDREMPLTLALMPVLPSHKIDPAQFSETSLNVPLGSGPYMITEVRPGERLTLKRNPDYWAKDLPIHRGLFNFDEIRIEYFRDANALFEAFKAGLIDYREETNPTRWLSSYDMPALNDGRMVKTGLPLGVPKGMEGFAFNTRRTLFKDIRVREALAMMFDFEWINQNLFGGLYTRTKSFFDESELSSSGIPASAGEKALLAPFPDAVRADILNGEWKPPVADGSGRDRNPPAKALALLHAAGYQVKDSRLVRDGQPLTFEILVRDRNQERLALNYAESLRRIGVIVSVRQVDDVQYQRRRQKFDFDMMMGAWYASASPGNEQRTRWGSASANQEASFNLAGAQSPAIDAMIVALLGATSREDFITAVRAYDRVLLSGFYIVPLYHSSQQWFAAWTTIARPEKAARYGAPLFGATLDTWWRKAP